MQGSPGHGHQYDRCKAHAGIACESRGDLDDVEFVDRDGISLSIYHFVLRYVNDAPPQQRFKSTSACFSWLPLASVAPENLPKRFFLLRLATATTLLAHAVMNFVIKSKLVQAVLERRNTIPVHSEPDPE